MPTRAELKAITKAANDLATAIEKNRLDVARALLDAHPGIGQLPHALLAAVRAANPEGAALALLAGADPNMEDGAGTDGPKPLQWLVRQRPWKLGHTAVFGILVDAGADVNARTHAGHDTLVACAAIRGVREPIDLLVAAGAEVTVHDAACLGELERVRDALAADPDLLTARQAHTQSLHGGWGTLLDFTAASALGSAEPETAQRLGELAAHLLGAGADPEGQVFAARHPLTPVQVAAHSDNETVLRVLVDAGADPAPALHGALGAASMRVLTLLDGLDLPVDETGDPKLGNSLLAEQIRGGRIACARWLLTNGADATTVDDNGWTVLHYAASRGVDPDFLAELITAGANPAHRDANDETALDIARRRKRAKLVGLLDPDG